MALEKKFDKKNEKPGTFAGAPGRRILLVEDEPLSRALLFRTLKDESVELLSCPTGAEALETISATPPDLILLDLGLPDIEGGDVLRRLREWSDIPVIILSARESSDEKVLLLDSGARDYITKPYSPPEVTARIRAALRDAAMRREKRHVPNFECDGLCVDFAKHRVTVRGTDVHFTATEFSILRVLVQNKGRVVSKAEMKMHVWGDSRASIEEQLRVHMTALRKKLRANGIGDFIKTQYGVGHRID